MNGWPIVAAMMVLAASPAAAAITRVDFRGSGNVAFSRVGPDPGLPQPAPPAIGTPVTISGTLFLGELGIADDFTGDFSFDESALFDSSQGFAWRVAGGDSRASTADSFAYAYGGATFAGGRLTGVDLYLDYDGDDHRLFAGGWRTSYSYQDAEWGGSFALAVPEPSSWALMIAGFGLVGAAARRRGGRTA